jgi:branched-chain amino acid transport system substrate-binding protein
MRKSLIVVLSVVVAAMMFSPCAFGVEKPIKIGINAPITGDIPKVGEGTKFAAQMWQADVKAAGGLEIGGKKYPVELVIEDNEAKAESAVKANTKMITEDEVLVIIGPQSSKQAVPAGDVANNYKTPMITPWSTNPDSTKDRPFVFRGWFSRSFPGTGFGKFYQK